MANTFSNDGSFYEQFLKMQTGPPGAAPSVAAQSTPKATLSSNETPLEQGASGEDSSERQPPPPGGDQYGYQNYYQEDPHMAQMGQGTGAYGYPHAGGYAAGPYGYGAPYGQSPYATHSYGGAYGAPGYGMGPYGGGGGRGRDEGYYGGGAGGSFHGQQGGFSPRGPGGGRGGFYGPPGGRPPRPDEKPSRSLWLGNVHPETSDQELREVFQQFGGIESIKIVPHKNCAFVNFVDLDVAMAAHRNSFGKIIHGQEIRVGWGKAEERRDGKEGRDMREDTGPRSKNLWIGNVSGDVTEDMIRERFAAYGRIESIKLLPAKNCAFVNFDNVESATNAKRQLSGQYLGSRPMKINYGRIETGPEDRGPVASPPFFSSPPPAPTDSNLQNIIDKMAEYVQRNGPAFENMMKDKERNNPKLQFLQEGNEWHDYYRWKVYSLRAPKPQSSPALETDVMSPGAVSGPLSLQDKRELANLLQTLDGTKESIKQGKDWIFQHWGQAESIAMFMRTTVEEADTWEKKLHLLYLVNDVLHHARSKREQAGTLDSMSEAFKLPVVFMLRVAYHDQPPEHQDKIIQLLRLWEGRGIYGTATVRRIEDAVTAATQPMEPPHTLDPSYASSAPTTNPVHALLAQLGMQKKDDSATSSAFAYSYPDTDAQASRHHQPAGSPSGSQYHHFHGSSHRSTSHLQQQQQSPPWQHSPERSKRRRSPSLDRDGDDDDHRERRERRSRWDTHHQHHHRHHDDDDDQHHQHQYHHHQNDRSSS